jgi:hypothetical protein
MWSCARRQGKEIQKHEDQGNMEYAVMDMKANAIDLDRLRHDPLMKIAVGRHPQTGAPLASQSTISRLTPEHRAWLVPFLTPWLYGSVSVLPERVAERYRG